ncbi:MAG: hypothetical protein QM820_50245 [Minicystis sp.]
MTVAAQLHDVAGLEVALLVEEVLRGRLVLVIPGHVPARLHPQLAAGMGLVAGAVTQLRHVGELVLAHLLAGDPAVEADHPGLGGSVSVEDGDLEAPLQERDDLGRRGRRARERVDEPIAEERAAHLVDDLGLDPGLLPVLRAGAAAHQLGLVVLVDHRRHAGDEHEARRAGDADVLEERGHVAGEDEVGDAAVDHRMDHVEAAGGVVQRHVEEADVRDGGQVRFRRRAPLLADQALREHGPFGRAGAARGVEDGHERIGLAGPPLGGEHVRHEAVLVPDARHVGHGDEHEVLVVLLAQRVHAGGEVRGAGAILLLVIHDDDAAHRLRVRERRRDGVELGRAAHDGAGPGLAQDLLEIGRRHARLQGHGDGREVEAGEVGHHPIDAAEAADGDPIPGLHQARVVQPARERLDARPQLGVAQRAKAREIPEDAVLDDGVALAEGRSIGVERAHQREPLDAGPIPFADALDRLRRGRGAEEIGIVREALLVAFERFLEQPLVLPR